MAPSPKRYFGNYIPKYLLLYSTTLYNSIVYKIFWLFFIKISFVIFSIIMLYKHKKQQTVLLYDHLPVTCFDIIFCILSIHQTEIYRFISSTIFVGFAVISTHAGAKPLLMAFLPDLILDHAVQ